MSAVLYDNLRAEIVGSAGIRQQRISLRQATTNLLLPRQPEAPRKPPMLGRTHEVADAFAAIRAGWSVGFHSASGYGKTTLLPSIVTATAERGLTPTAFTCGPAGDRIGDLLQDLAARLYAWTPVKLSPQQCAQLLRQVSATVALDDLRAGPDQADRRRRGHRRHPPQPAPAHAAGSA